jgi:hypothetical protein
LRQIARLCNSILFLTPGEPPPDECAPLRLLTQTFDNSNNGS